MSWARRKSKLLLVTGALAAMTLPRPNDAQQVQISKSVSNVYFGSVAEGQSHDVDITIKPNGPCTLVEDGLSIRGQDATDFRIVYDGVTGHTVTPQSNPLTVTIRFRPSHTGPASAVMIANAHIISGKCRLVLIPRDLAGVGIGQPQAVPPIALQPPTVPKQPDVPRVYIFIEGAQTSSDNFSAPVRAYLDTVAINSAGQQLNEKYDVLGMRERSNVKYATHNDKAKIESYIQTLPQGTEVYLIGHSWGGYVATQIAADENVRKIDGLITIDPVDRNFDSSAPSDRNRPPATTNRPTLFASAKGRVAIWVDVDATLDDSTANSGKWDVSDRVAYLGGDWGIEPRIYATQLLLNDVVHHAEFGKMMQQVKLKIIQPPRQLPPTP